LLLLCVLLWGCLGAPNVLSPKGPGRLPEEGMVEFLVNVSGQKLWKAAVLEFRNIDILEASKKKSYIKGVGNDVCVEFKIVSTDEAHSVYTVKAVTLEGSPRIRVAQRFSSRIYKRAKSLWFSVTEHKGID